MIFVVVTFLTAAGPVGQVRSVEGFDTMKDCEAALSAEARAHAWLQARATERLGVPVTVLAECQALYPGVPA